MPTPALNQLLARHLDELTAQGRRKGAERVVTAIVPAEGRSGPRVRLAGCGDRVFLRMNSNSYLGLSLNREVIAAAERAARRFGAGPGAVRFISGTCEPHVELEERLAAFHGREAAMLFSAAYAAVLGVLPPLISDQTIVLSDALNHNSIINAVRLGRPLDKLVYRHLDLEDLAEKMAGCVGRARRLLVVSDGIFSMRGDHLPLAAVTALCGRFQERFPEGIITVMDDSHGVGAFGATGRGVEEHTGSRADILVATLGKAFGVNGGYVAGERTVIDYLRETAPLYIYSNPLTPAEAAAASRSLQIVASDAGLELLAGLNHLTQYFSEGLGRLGWEYLEGGHPIVPLLTRDTARTAELVCHLFDRNIRATGLAFPVVPGGSEEIRFQVNATHTEEDLDAVLAALADFARGGR
jgi:glycine C-acetyltransferase